MRASVLLLLLACSHDQSPVTVALVAPSASSTSSAPQRSLLDPPVVAREVVHGVIVDLRARRAVRTLLTENVQTGSDDGARAYVHLRADAVHRTTDEVRAYDMATGALLWSHEVGRCYVMAAAPAGVFCDSAKGSEIVLLDRATGQPRSIPTPKIGTASQLVRIASKVAVLSYSDEIAFFDATTGEAAGTLAVGRSAQGWRAGNDLACALAFGATTTIECFNASPRVVWSKPIPITGGELTAADEHDVLVTTSRWGSPHPESVVASLEDGREVAHLSERVQCMVRAADGRLDGLFRTAPTAAYLGLDGHERWKTTAIGEDSCSAVTTGDLVVVAAYSGISTGASLFGLDRATGLERWHGDVELLPIDHSKYKNEVTLRMVGGALVMRGIESSQDYLEIFDPVTGKRLFSTVRGR
jgi:hypothetical protein